MLKAINLELAGWKELQLGDKSSDHLAMAQHKNANTVIYLFIYLFIYLYTYICNVNVI